MSTEKDILKVAAVPISIALGDKQANLRAAAEAMAQGPADIDIYVLPELFSTGYLSEPDDARAQAEPNDGPVMQAIVSLAVKHNAAISGSFLACNADGLMYNRAFFITPEGEKYFYDKRHLFNISEESKIVAHGQALAPVIDFLGWHVSMAICYDIRFPVWVRNVDLKYDLLLVPANWPQKRSWAWTHLLQARAIENMAYVVGCNRSGTDEFGDYDNETYIYDYVGQDISQPQGSMVIAEVNKHPLDKFRKKFPVWEDADTFALTL